MKINNNFFEKKKIILGGVLILLGILSRTAWHIGDNVEFVTGSALLAGSYLGLGWAIVVPLVVMVITDILLGNTNIFLFTWSGFFLISCLGYLSNIGHSKGVRKVFLSVPLGIVSSLWFFLWTNFGVWLLDSWGMYPKTFKGLMDAYILGIPFLKMNLLGNLFFVPLAFFIFELGESMNWEMGMFIKKIERASRNI